MRSKKEGFGLCPGFERARVIVLLLHAHGFLLRVLFSLLLSFRLSFQVTVLQVQVFLYKEYDILALHECI